MVEKKSIVRELGEEELLLPGLVNSALLANDRIKYYFTLLQTAREKAEHPEREFPVLRTERETAGEEDSRFDRVVAGAVKKDSGSYEFPFAEEVFSRTRNCMAEMLKPLLATGGTEAEAFEIRLKQLTKPGGKEFRVREGEGLSGEFIRALTSGDRKAGDSLHLLVMDVHKALSRMQEELAGETIDGAKVYMIDARDRRLVKAFMKGVNRTKPLKFEHPGLGTTATRTADKLVIQNDIGETEAHVLVVNVKGLEASVTYTDVHMQRVLFFRSLFEGTGTVWEDTLSKSSDSFEENVYHLSVGKFRGKNGEELEAFLTHLGAKLVFLIDWNRARKRLRNFMRNADCSRVLHWAAENECGHRGFLVLGGEQLIFEALELASRVPIRYGEPLHQVMGRERTVEFFQWVLKRATEGLLAEEPLLLIRDEIKAELLRYFNSAEQDLMEICAEHASLTVEVAGAVRDSLLHVLYGGEAGFVLRNAKRAKQWERQADELVNRVRTISRRIDAVVFFERLICLSDDVLDYLEEAAFFTTFVPENAPSEKILSELCKLADTALTGNREFLKTMYAFQCTTRGCSLDEMQFFLGSVAKVIELEEKGDHEYRVAKKIFVRECQDFRECFVSSELARNIEEAINSLMWAAYTVRERAFELNAWERR